MLWRVFCSRVINCNRLERCICIQKLIKMPFYAVAKGRTSGIFMTWADCEAQVKGFSGARYKKFDTVVAAQDFITTTTSNSITTLKSKSDNNRKSLETPTLNLKRTFSTTSSQSQPKQKDDHVAKKKSKSTRHSSNSDASDSSDDLNTILTKQMDDIEKRLKSFEKGVDKIIKNSTKNTSKKAILIDPVNREKSEGEFDVDSNGYVQVYTDGACSSNGRSGARAGLGVYWADNHHLNVSAPVSGRATNNCGEIQAATRAIRTAIDNGVQKLTINTDSQFLINAVTKWMSGWKRKGWKLQTGEPVKNEIDFKELDSLQNKLQIKWNYVEAHKGVHGNEMADQLAKAGASMYNK